MMTYAFDTANVYRGDATDWSDAPVESHDSGFINALYRSASAALIRGALRVREVETGKVLMLYAVTELLDPDDIQARLRAKMSP